MFAGEQVIFRVRRPMYLINSTIIVEDGEGNEIGEVKQRWHLWKRKYDLYFGRRQFADIEGNFLAWEFVLKNESGGEPALWMCMHQPDMGFNAATGCMPSFLTFLLPHAWVRRAIHTVR